MKAYYADKIITAKAIRHKSYLMVAEGKITGIRSQIDDDIDVTSYPGKTIAPGFIDIHTHGGLGYEPGSGNIEGLKKWSQFKYKQGVTGFLATTPSVPLQTMEEAAREIREICRKPITNVLGLQLEGPFFLKGAKIGAQNPEYVVEKFPESYRNFIRKYSDIIPYLALDPLHPESREIVEFCRQQKIEVSAGHSEILYSDFLQEKEYGYSAVTHTFNGMKGLHHRQPGLAYAGCMDEDLFAEIICDGFHIIFPVLKLFFKLRGYENTVLITDSMLAAGMPAGTTYKLGGIEVTVSPEGKVFKEDGGLAGSTLTMAKAVSNLVTELKIPLVQAIKMASLNPAQLIKVDESKGSLEQGKDADFIVLNQGLEVMATYNNGEKVYSNMM